MTTLITSSGHFMMGIITTVGVLAVLIGVVGLIDITWKKFKNW